MYQTTDFPNFSGKLVFLYLCDNNEVLYQPLGCDQRGHSANTDALLLGYVQGEIHQFAD